MKLRIQKKRRVRDVSCYTENHLELCVILQSFPYVIHLLSSGHSINSHK